MKTKLALALALIAPAAFAQTWTTQDDGSFKISRGTFTSPTAVVSLPVNPSARGITVYASGTTIASATIVATDRTGVLFTTLATIAVGTTGNQVSVTIPSPFYFSRLRVSPTTALTGTNSINAVVIQAE